MTARPHTTVTRPRRVTAVVVGAGHAGLAVSAKLLARGIDHVVLERDAIASAWRRRWDSLRLLTPNWQCSLPGYRYAGPDPDGFMTKDEVARFIERYADVIGAPGIDKADFELFSLAVSAQNGCGMCIDSHEKVLGQHGVKPETIQAAARIAAVMTAVATVHATL